MCSGTRARMRAARHAIAGRTTNSGASATRWTHRARPATRAMARGVKGPDEDQRRSSAATRAAQPALKAHVVAGEGEDGDVGVGEGGAKDIPAWVKEREGAGEMSPTGART